MKNFRTASVPPVPTYRREAMFPEEGFYPEAKVVDVLGEKEKGYGAVDEEAEDDDNMRAN